MAFAHPAIIEIFNKIQMPYCISTPTSALAMLSLFPTSNKLREQLVAQTTVNREALIRTFTQPKAALLGIGKLIGGSQANFIVLPILKRGTNAADQRDNTRARIASEQLHDLYRIAVRFIGALHGYEGCLRITIGTEEENAFFVESLTDVLTVMVAVRQYFIQQLNLFQAIRKSCNL